MDSNVVLVEGIVVNGVVLYLVVAALLDVVVDGTKYIMPKVITDAYVCVIIFFKYRTDLKYREGR